MNKPLRLLLALSLSLGACATEDGNDLPCDSPNMFYPDSDGDGYGDDAGAMASCETTVPVGFALVGGDCRDDQKTAAPGGKEVCDDIDNDCDGKIDDADASLDQLSTFLFYKDGDHDGFGNPDEDVSVRGCKAPTGYVASKTDCDDTRSSVNPGAKEICDDLDNDCDGKWDISDPSLDLTTATKYYKDTDNDQHGAGTAQLACDQPWGWVAANDDCNDADNLTFPGGSEICDGADNDCDGGIDGTAAQPNKCNALVGTYTGSYSHLTQEKVGSTVVNSMSCTGTGNAALALDRRPGIQGVFTCTYSGGMTLFSSSQKVTLRANVALDGSVTGTAEHEYSGSSLKRTYTVSGTQTPTGLMLTGTGSWYPSSFSTVPWQVSFNFSTTR